MNFSYGGSVRWKCFTRRSMNVSSFIGRVLNAQRHTPRNNTYTQQTTSKINITQTIISPTNKLSHTRALCRWTLGDECLLLRTRVLNAQRHTPRNNTHTQQTTSQINITQTIISPTNKLSHTTQEFQ
jgi:hypothetical protein